MTPFDFVGDGMRIPITNMIDIHGDDTDDPEMAVMIVGPLPNGRWLACEARHGEIVRRAPH